MFENLKYWVWLSSLPKFPTVKFKQLLDAVGDPVNLWNLSEQELRRLPPMTPSLCRLLLDKNLRAEAEGHLENIYKNDIRVITIKDEAYPIYLKNIYDPPLVLYFKGKMRKQERLVAVVGSRRASGYGLSMAEKISYELAGLGIAVISGMARGIDSCAHRGALGAGGRTIAVLGCGLDIVYPEENKGLMEQIMETGLVLSEYLPGYAPMAMNFPARNRIISGMSMGVVVVEANERSGSLITAGYALDQGREVFAIPGNINQCNSRGTNRLIREGAKIVTCIDDILEELNFSAWEASEKCDGEKSSVNKPAGSKHNIIVENLNPGEQKVFELLNKEPLHIDVLAQKAGWSVQAASATLFMLELRNIVIQQPGKIFKLKE